MSNVPQAPRVDYWVFCESQLDQALREWASAPTHSDISEEACKARFAAVSGFLYSEQAIRLGLYQGPKPADVSAGEQGGA